MKTLTQKLSAFAATAVGAFVLSASQVAAVNTNYAYVQSSFGQNDLRLTAELLINMLLGVIALIAVILIIIGGVKWMTAAGEPSRVDSAKKTLVAAALGLAITLMAWAITLFALDVILNSTGAPAV